MRHFSRGDVKKIRYILGMSQQEFARVIGIAQPNVHKIEAGKVRLTERVNENIHKVVFLYIDKETLYKILDGEIEL